MAIDLPHDHGKGALDEMIALQGNSTDSFERVADLYSLVADSTRLRIFWVLCHTEECVINLAAIMQMSSPAVSHHLQKLRAAGLISSRREGKEVYYKASDSQEARALHDLTEALSTLSCPEIN